MAYADVVEAVKDADILLFILPHQFVERTCLAIKSHVKTNAFAVSFSKVRLIDLFETCTVNLIRDSTSVKISVLIYFPRLSVDSWKFLVMC